MLYHECLMREDWSIEPVGEALKFIKEMHRRLFRQGLYPNPTPPDATKFYEFRMTRRERRFFGGRSSNSFELSFPDAAGEWYENYERAKATYPPEADPVRKLADCHAMLLLVDPAPLFARGTPAETSYEAGVEEDQSTSSYFEMLLNLIEALRGRESHLGPIAKYAALVFTKMDKEEYWEDRERPEQFAQKVLNPYELRIIESAFPPGRLRYFTSSAVGVFQDKDGRLRPNYEEFTDADDKRRFRILEPSRIQPLNVFEPLEWLLDELRAHPQS